jgi:hypothetical protein
MCAMLGTSIRLAAPDFGRVARDPGYNSYTRARWGSRRKHVYEGISNLYKIDRLKYGWVGPPFPFQELVANTFTTLNPMCGYRRAVCRVLLPGLPPTRSKNVEGEAGERDSQSL